jgi:hypothetical protein
MLGIIKSLFMIIYLGLACGTVGAIYAKPF